MNLGPLGCFSARTIAVRRTKLSNDVKKQGVCNKSCIGSWLAVMRQPQRFLVFSACIRGTTILN